MRVVDHLEEEEPHAERAEGGREHGAHEQQTGAAREDGERVRARWLRAGVSRGLVGRSPNRP